MNINLNPLLDMDGNGRISHDERLGRAVEETGHVVVLEGAGGHQEIPTRSDLGHVVERE